MIASRLVPAVLGLFVIGLNFVHAGSISTRIPQLHSAAVIVQDQHTGEFLLEKESTKPMPIASITKLMTAMVLLDSELEMEETITITEDDKDRLRHSHSHLYVGTKLTRREALRLALLASENRAAHALGRTYPGGLKRFVELMNEKARTMGLRDTKFEEPTGLSGGNLSSARDLSRMVDESSRYPLISSFSTQPEYTLIQGKRQLRFVNTNPLVRSSRWKIGLSKTGYIQEGGRCLVMQAQLAKRSVLIVLLNSNGKNTRVGDANRIKQWMEGTGTKKKKRKRR